MANASTSARVSGHGGPSGITSGSRRPVAMTSSVPPPATVCAMLAAAGACSAIGIDCTV